jgi:hypothetical protein
VAGIPFAPEWVYRRQRYYRQAKPYDLPLEYHLEDQRVLGYSGSPYTYRSTSDCPPKDEFAQTESFNKAHNKYKEALSDRSQWGVNLAEIEQSVRLISGSVSSLLKFTRKLKKFDFVGAGRELGVGLPSSNRLRRTAESFGNNWLAYHFGWEPLVQDIGSAVTQLCKGSPPKRKIRAKGRSVRRIYFRETGTSDPKYFDGDIEDRCLIQALVSAPNPNLFLLDSLGFINPLSVAWELVPFSFVADWFGNVGQVLDSYVDIWDVDVKHTFVTHFQTTNLTERYPYRTDGALPVAHPEPLQAVYRSIYLDRTTGGVPAPTLQFKIPSQISPVRGATAIALLIAQMGR